MIFVFGSNREGRHGKGAALHARTHHGAIYGNPSGLQGNSYAIVTKELRPNHPPVTLEEIKQGVDGLRRFATDHPEMQFEVSELGCYLAGFHVAQIAPLFNWVAPWTIKGPKNVILPESFTHHLLWFNNPYE